MPKSILVVDDAVFMRRLLRELLAGAGYDVYEAVNGPDAIEKYSEMHPDLVTLDIAMPEMTGLEVLAALRAQDERVKAIVISALGSDAALAQAASAGACGYVRKPFEPSAVLDAVRKALLVQHPSS